MKFDKETAALWAAMARQWLALNVNGVDPETITTGRDAWTVAARCGITEEAYRDRNVTDGHIQTALERIFPNAVFKDKKVY